MNCEHSHCPRCGVAFMCNPQNISACHCSQVELHPIERQYISLRFSGCLCHQCLLSMKEEFLKMPDYYMDGGFFVFTEKFHLKRGSCCKSGCRHCPYGFKKPT